MIQIDLFQLIRLSNNFLVLFFLAFCVLLIFCIRFCPHQVKKNFFLASLIWLEKANLLYCLNLYGQNCYINKSSTAEFVIGACLVMHLRSNSSTSLSLCPRGSGVATFDGTFASVEFSTRSISTSTMKFIYLFIFKGCSLKTLLANRGGFELIWERDTPVNSWAETQTNWRKIIGEGIFYENKSLLAYKMWNKGIWRCFQNFLNSASASSPVLGRISSNPKVHFTVSHMQLKLQYTEMRHAKFGVKLKACLQNTPLV